MASIGDIASKKICSGVDSSLNTGKLGCLSLFGTPTHLIALRKGEELDATEDFSMEYFTQLVMEGKAIGLIDATAFEDVSSEDTYSTNARGVKRLNVLGLPEYRLTFEEGHYFYKQLSKITSFKNYDFVIGDQEGNWLIVNKSNGNFKGFAAGHVTAELTSRKVEGGEAESKSLLIQFLNRIEWDTTYSIVHAEDINFSPSEFPLVNGTDVVYNTVPSDSDTVLDVKVVLSADRNSTIDGLVAADFEVLVNGVAAAISSVTEPSTGNYNITIPAVSTGDTVRIRHHSASPVSPIANSNDVLYRVSANNTTTVVA